MKELSIEEKAKRYDEALERARNIVNSINVGLIGKDSFEAVFPELKESDNTDIRTEIKNIITYFYGSTKLFIHLHSKEELLAWLEKQGEQKPKRIISAEAKKAMYDRPVWSEEDERTYKSVLYAFENHFPLNCEQQKFVKSLRPQNRWKPTDEQMKALDILLLKGEFTYVGQAPCLQSLYIDLKAL